MSEYGHETVARAAFENHAQLLGEQGGDDDFVSITQNARR